MALANFQTKQKIATLIEVKLPNTKEPMRYQNWCQGEYFWRGNPYLFAAFVGAPSTSRQTTFDNSGVQVVLENRSARIDGLRPIREQLKATEGWARARVTLIQIWPEDLTATPIIERLQIMNSGIGGARVDFSLQSPFNAVNGVVPAFYVDQRVCPELPQGNTGRI